jgi:hypothetical protein
MTDPVEVGGAHRRMRTAWLWLGAILAVVVVASVLPSGSSRPAIRPLLIYVGADDCAPCRAWQRGDGAIFKESKDFARLTYREVKSAHLHEILDDKYWPEDIRGYRDRLKRSDGVPLWFVVADAGIVTQHYGAGVWKNDVLPTLNRILRREGR